MRLWSRIALLWRSTVGKKGLMAVSALVLVGYMLIHVVGNLLIYLGPHWINGWGAFLHATGPLLWAIRGVLLLAFVLHIVLAAQLKRDAHDARPQSYARYEPQVATPAARTMWWGGVALLLFTLYHVPQFTAGWWHPAFASGDDYSNVVVLFRRWWAYPVYAAALVAVALHMYHGTWSMLRTLGLAQPSPEPRRRPLAVGLTVLVAGGFLSIMIAVAAGLLRPLR
jgi:succinate dehydrogenase / fumarate reductase, cytochrome b subunit